MVGEFVGFRAGRWGPLRLVNTADSPTHSQANLALSYVAHGNRRKYQKGPHTVVGYGVMVNIGDSHSPARGSIPRIRGYSFCSFVFLVVKFLFLFFFF
jgi:hypothetical protein